MQTNERIEIKWTEPAEIFWPASIQTLALPRASATLLSKKRVGPAREAAYLSLMNDTQVAHPLPRYDRSIQKFELIAFGAVGAMSAALVWFAANSAAQFVAGQDKSVSTLSQPIERFQETAKSSTNIAVSVPQVEPARSKPGRTGRGT